MDIRPNVITFQKILHYIPVALQFIVPLLVYPRLRCHAGTVLALHPFTGQKPGLPSSHAFFPTSTFVNYLFWALSQDHLVFHSFPCRLKLQYRRKRTRWRGINRSLRFASWLLMMLFWSELGFQISIHCYIVLIVRIVFLCILYFIFSYYQQHISPTYRGCISLVFC